MSVSVIIGLQWGDEGKGKIVDFAGDTAEVVVRCQGGSNAGHTVVIGKDVYKLHLVPSGVLRDNVISVIGNGVVLDPAKVCAEIEQLSGQGVDFNGRLLISDRCHLVLPFHKVIDALQEKNRGAANLGTTIQGIGPCYCDKSARAGLRGHHLMDEKNFPKLVEERVKQASKLAESLGGEPLDVQAMLDEILPAAEKLRPYMADTVEYLHKALDENKSILMEGAQGAMLDLDFGTYPYLTSSNTTAGGCCTGSGVPPTKIDDVHGVIKTFTTRVGTGPFPTELEGEIGGLLRGTGKNQWDEFGTTTGRPRRCGWLDMVVGRYACQVNGVTKLHLTKLDILSDFDELKVCVAYEVDGKRTMTYPSSLEQLEKCKPVYETFKGWKSDLSRCASLEEMPKEAQAYIECIKKHSGAEVASVSFGPAREHTVWCNRD